MITAIHSLTMFDCSPLKTTTAEQLHSLDTSTWFAAPVVGLEDNAVVWFAIIMSHGLWISGQIKNFPALVRWTTVITSGA